MGTFITEEILSEGGITGTTISGGTLYGDGSNLTGLAPTTRAINTSAPLSGGGDLSANRTISIADAVADGTTKGAATFTTNDFDSSSGVISIDYTNGQAASTSLKGFLTSSDWNTFNNKSRLQYNYATIAQIIAGNTVTYVTNSNITTANIMAGTIVTWVISASRAGTGTSAPVWTVRFGTNSSTADATLLTFTGVAQTNAADTGQIMITCVFRTVGSGISAVLTGHYNLTHNLATTGMANVPANNVFATSAGFNSTTANAFLGLTLNPGANATWTINQMYVKIEDIA